jgi:hypothetical protein
MRKWTLVLAALLLPGGLFVLLAAWLALRSTLGRKVMARVRDALPPSLHRGFIGARIEVALVEGDCPAPPTPAPHAGRQSTGLDRQSLHA